MEPTQVDRVAGPGRAARLALPVLALAALGCGTIANSDDLFPFGPMAQFATATKLDGEVRSTYVLADTTRGEQVNVPLTPTGTGIGRAEVEGQLDRIIAHPDLLQALSDAYGQLHPFEPQYTRLYLVRDVYRLRGGEQVGEPTTSTLATWTVRR